MSMPDGGSSLEEVNGEGTFELGLQGGCAAYAIDRSNEGKLEGKDGHAAMGCICRERGQCHGQAWVGRYVPKVMS